MPSTAVNIVFFIDKTKIGNQINPYLQAGGRRFESDYLHKVAAESISYAVFPQKRPKTIPFWAFFHILYYRGKSVLVCALRIFLDDHFGFTDLS